MAQPLQQKKFRPLVNGAGLPKNDLQSASRLDSEKVLEKIFGTEKILV